MRIVCFSNGAGADGANSLHSSCHGARLAAQLTGLDYNGNYTVPDLSPLSVITLSGPNSTITPPPGGNTACLTVIPGSAWTLAVGGISIGAL